MSVFVAMLADKEFRTFSILNDSHNAIDFALMTEMGFFALKGIVTG